jgi:hypothetical protein
MVRGTSGFAMEEVGFLKTAERDCHLADTQLYGRGLLPKELR